ncbi:hypothetical protein C8R44DRAFT_744454 [Mycena epipterygia]|nr:hypothetical protein C8R44DRAFT_744454 [Mycena epipterygia]
MAIVWVTHVNFRLAISAAPQNSVEGYLFLCPSQNLKIGKSSFRWPDCPAYWSLDPSGVERLSRDEAIRLTFPPMDFGVIVGGSYWDATVYAGLRQFHQANGFNPESRDLALHLGYGLIQLSNEAEAAFALVEDDPSGVENHHKSEQVPANDDNIQESTAVEYNEISVNDEEIHRVTVEASQTGVLDLLLVDETIELLSLDAQDSPVSQLPVIDVVKFTFIIFLSEALFYDYMW